MSTIAPANALKLSAWLALHEPGFFKAILAKTAQRNRGFGFLGDDSVLTEFVPDIPSVSSAPMDTITITADAPAQPLDLSSFTPDLQSVGSDASGSSTVSDSITAAVASPPVADPTTANADPSFWSQVGSGLGTAAGAVGQVAGALLSPPVVNSLANAAGAYFASQAKSNVAQAQLQAQQLAVQTQLARTAAGYSPAPITYVRNPVTGGVTPVYAANTGAQPLTGALAGLLTPSTLGQTPTIVWIGAGLLLLAILSSAVHRN